jgi:hypothetical protein
MNEPTLPLPAWRLADARWTFLVRNASSPAPGVCWRWRATAVNGVRWEGDEVFDTRELCEADAATHGYVSSAGEMKETR